MNERDLQVLEQYPFSVNASWRVRGAFLLDSSEGRLLIREFSGSAAKVEKEQQLLAHLKACGHRTDQIIADAEGRLVTVYREYLNYLVKESPEGRECDTRSESEILAAVSLLAALHRDMKQVPGFERKDVERLAGIDAREELARHNQELRKIYTFVRRKNRKNEFEAAYIQCFSSIREEAERAERLLKETSYEALRRQALEEGQICHGEYIHHNLLVADAIHRSEGKRPIFPEHSIIIVDEAHKLPETAQQMLGVTLAAEEIRNLILQLKEERYLLAAEMLEDSTDPLLRKLAQPREEAEPVEACLRLLTAPSRTLPIIQRQIGSLLSPLGSRQLNTVLDAVKLFTSSQTDMIFYTAEDVSTGGAMLCAAAGDITQRIKKILWQPDQAFVLTSGTMAVGSDFRRFKTQAGLEKGHRVMESVSPSPFDYRNNGLLYLPQIPPRQRVEDTDVYFNELTAELVGLIKAASGHALVLFTSYAAMSAVKERLWEESLPFPLLTLGRNAPHIIEQFRHTPGAVLLATGAAWEGFDFPGDCVSLLIIPRLPFAYPDARKERELEKYPSLHAFIREVAVPEMQIKLRQGFGRAIRTESDTCVIAILDERACRGRRYAQAVSEALPEMRRTGSLREVTRFLREKKPESYFEVGR